MIVLSLMFIVFFSYVYYIYKRFGVLKSISDSSYALKGPQRGLFVAFCWLLAFGCYFIDFGMFGALAAGGLFFTGATITHKDNRAYSELAHKVGSIGAIALLFIAILFKGNFIIPVFFSAQALYIYYTLDNKIWWIEILAFIWVFLFLLLTNV